MRSGVGGLIAANGLGIEVFERAGFNSAGFDERVDLGLLEPNHAAEPVGRQLTFIDEPVQGSRREAKRGRSFLRGQPVSVGVRHEFEASTISHLSTSFNVPHSLQRAHCA